jgi:hypothetical protein
LHDSFSKLPELYPDIYLVSVSYKGLTVVEMCGERLAKVMKHDGSISKVYHDKILSSPLINDPSVRSYCYAKDIERTTAKLVEAAAKNVDAVRSFIQGTMDRFKAVEEAVEKYKLDTTTRTAVKRAANNTKGKVSEVAMATKAKELAEAAPRCFYAYDPATGSRPCTIDMERYHKENFELLKLPSCPFVKECFTRSDCLYITGKCSEEEGAAIVKKELSQMGRDVKELTLENTQSLWPYI